MNSGKASPLFKLHGNVYTSTTAAPFELTFEHKGAYHQVKLWQIAHRVKVGDRIYEKAPMVDFPEVWEVQSIVTRGVVVKLVRGGSPHEHMIDWLGAVWVIDVAPYDVSARSYDKAIEWAKQIREIDK